MFGTIIFAHSFCLSNRLFIIYFNKSITNKSTSWHFGRISRNVIVETSELVAFVTYQKYKIIIYSVSFTYLTYHLMASFLLPICLRCKNIFSFIQLISILRRAHTVKVNKFIDSCKKLVVNFMLSSCDSVFNYLLKIFKTKLTKKKMKSAPFFRVICCCVSTSYLFCTLYFFYLIVVLSFYSFLIFISVSYSVGASENQVVELTRGINRLGFDLYQVK